MTLDERIEKRLLVWRSDERRHRAALLDLQPDDDELWLHTAALGRLERCIKELENDLNREAPAHPRRHRP